MEFFIENLYLIFIIIVSGVLILYPSLFFDKSLNIKVSDAVLLMNREPSIIIDVREAEKFEAGHILNAINIPFQEFFNGLYISCEQVNTGGLLLELDLLDTQSKITLYYHNTESDSLTYDFQINSNADKMTRWSHDYSSTNIESLLLEDDIDVAYVQGGAGLRTYITLPSLESLKDSNYVIHKAELTFPYFFSENDSVFTIPSKLGLAAVNSEGKLEVLTEDQNIQGASYFDGNSNVLDQTYTFNIARYIHKVIAEGYTNKLALYVPSSVLNPERVLLSNGTENTISLRLFVSKQ